MPGRDEPRARHRVVPRQHPVADAEHHVGQLRDRRICGAGKPFERVDPSRRPDSPPHLPEMVAGPAPGRRRAARAGSNGLSGSSSTARRDPFSRSSTTVVAPLLPDDCHRIGGQKRIPAEPRPWSRAVEKKAIWKSREQFATADGIGRRFERLDNTGHQAFAIVRAVRPRIVGLIGYPSFSGRPASSVA